MGFPHSAAAPTPPNILRPLSVAYAASVTPNSATTDVLTIGALTGGITIANPTGTPVDGQVLRIRFTQDGVGGRVVAYGTAFAFGTDVTAAMDATGISASWERIFQWNSTAAKWRATGIVRGF